MKYIPVRTATIRGNQKLLFNLYLKIREREVLYIRENDPIEEKRLVRLKGKKVKKVYIENDSEPKYLEYLDLNLKRLDSPNVSVAEKGDILEGQTKCVVEDVFENPTDKKTYERSKVVVDKYVDFINKNDKALSHLLAMKSDSFDSYQHALNVSSLAIGLAKFDNVTNKKELELLGMGALMHDIGKTNLKIDITKPIEDYSEAEMVELKKHPDEGARILNQGEFVHAQVVRYVREHEEMSDGSGYPEGIRLGHMSAYTIYISLANVYDRYVTFNKLSPEEALKRITIDKVGLYKIEQINNLKKLLKKQGLY